MKSTMLNGLIIIMSIWMTGGCAIHSAVPIVVATKVPSLPSKHAVPSWTGQVRLALGTSNQDVDGQDAAIVMNTVKSLLEQVGVPVEIQCLEHDGNIGTSGAMHARIRVGFTQKLTIEQKFEALSVLQSLEPTTDAYITDIPGVPVARSTLSVAAKTK